MEFVKTVLILIKKNHMLNKQKIISLLATALLIVLSNQSKAQSFTQDNQYVSLGYGFGNFGNLVFNAIENDVNNSNFTYSSVGPLFLKYEFAVDDRFGIGVSFAYLTGSGSWDYTSNNTTYQGKIDRTGYNVNLRFNWHFGNHDIIDPYLGLGAGYRYNKLDITSNEPNYESDISLPNFFPFGMEFTIGSRFMFSENIGAFVEVGAARAIFQVGLTSKF